MLASDAGPVKRFLTSLALSTCLFSACNKDSERAHTSLVDIERCQRGIEKAIHEPTLKEANRVYFSTCSDIYTQPACRQAHLAAANMEPIPRLNLIVRECQKAYCKLFTGEEPLLCKPETANDPGGWAQLHERIIERDAEKRAPVLHRAMWRFLAISTRWAETNPDGPAPLESAAEPAPPPPP